MNNYQFLKETYIDNGLKIFPIVENGKTPLIEAWQKDCSNSTLQILYWIQNAPTCNWGLPCTPNNLFVIDIDVHNVDGYDSIRRLFDDIGLDDVDTLKQETPSGGMHMIFLSDDELKTVSNTANSFKNYPGIDVRTDGYIACAPSSINGKEYKLNGNQIKSMPQVLKEYILSQKEIIKTKERKEDYVKPVEVDEGGRDTALFEYITNIYYKNNLSEDEVLVLAENFNQTICKPPLPNRTVRYKVKKAFRKDKGKCIILWLNKDEYYDGMED